MIQTVLIIFLLASGNARAIYGTDADCQLYQQMLARHDLLVDDVDLPRQRPTDVLCQCVNVEMEPFE